MRTALMILLLLPSLYVMSQQGANDDHPINEQQLEDLAEANEAESQDDYDLTAAASFLENPVSINAPAEAFRDFPLLEPIQIDNLIRYRSLLGDLISIYELQAVPGFSMDDIHRILPYVQLNNSEFSRTAFMERWKGGKQTLLVRPAFAASKNKNPITSDSAALSSFTGSGNAVFLKYTYRFRDLLQYGFVGEKDAGEPFLFSKKQAGFDFCSFHVFIRNLGVINFLAIGDFTVNLGQGLIHWQSQAFKKSAAVLNIKRQANILRPYSSAGEYNFCRGIASTVSFHSLETTVFASSRNLSAHLNQDPYYGEVISSLQTSGLHRTEAEINVRNNVTLRMIGGSLKFIKPVGHIALNGVRYSYSLPLLKRDDPYNRFAIKGSQWANYSADYSYTFRNFHFFGEAAMDKNGSKAFVNGIMAALGPVLDIALLQRSIEPAYQTIYGNAFTESGLPSNENGYYFGISLKLNDRVKVDMYGDLFLFPWLRYRTDAPGFGFQYLCQLTYSPGKKAELYSRLKWRSKPLNSAFAGIHLNIPEDRVLVDWRSHVSFHVSHDVLLRCRAEFSWFSVNDKPGLERGFLQYADIVFKPSLKPYSANFRLLIFETDGYDTRLYSYENDLPLSGSTPAFFGNGIRITGNIKWHFRIKKNSNSGSLKNWNIETAAKFAHTIFYTNSGFTLSSRNIPSAPVSDIKMQILFAI